MDQFQLNLSRLLAHSMVLEAKGPEPAGEAWAVNTLLGQFAGGMLQQAPEVPHFKPINTTKEQEKAVAGNIANFGKISELAGNANLFNQNELNKMLESAVPGYRDMVSSIGSRINGFLSGELPDDVMGNIGRSAAHKSLSGGYGGSGMARNLVARDLGLSTLDLIGKGIDAGSRWIATARANTVAPQFDVSSMFITPQQRIQTQMWNREGQWNRDWLSNQVEAQHDWRTVLGTAISQTDQQITNTAMSMVGSAAGGAV